MYNTSCPFEKTKYGQLAQLVEHSLDVRRVSGSSPLLSTRGAVPALVGAAFVCPDFEREPIV